MVKDFFYKKDTAKITNFTTDNYKVEIKWGGFLHLKTHIVGFKIVGHHCVSQIPK